MGELNASTPDDPTRLTKRELVSLLALGLSIAGICAGVAFVPGAKSVPSPARPFKVEPPRWLIPFTLTDRTGRTVTDSELAGKFLVVNFAFTSCSLKCRAVNDRMADIQRLVVREPDIQLISLSVDPHTDTPSALAKFADSFGADTNRWLFLTGDKLQMYRLIEASFISRSPELTGLVPGGFAHTDNIMLVDPRGHVWASFNGLKTNVAAAVMSEIAKRRKVSAAK